LAPLREITAASSSRRIPILGGDLGYRQLQSARIGSITPACPVDPFAPAAVATPLYFRLQFSPSSRALVLEGTMAMRKTGTPRPSSELLANISSEEENGMYKPTSRTLLPILIGIVAACTIWLTERAKAQDQTVSALYAFGMVGIASGQTARLNVVTAGVENDFTMELLFLDSEAKILLRSVEKVVPGHAVLLDLHYNAIPPPINDRRHQIRALVKFTNQPARKGYILPSLEVIDDITGRTTVLGGNPEG
jgi:hypothetical protein